MATFSGWNIIPIPTSPSAPATIEFTATDIVAVSVSPFTGQQQTQDWQSAWLEASISLPPLTHVQAQEWISFLLALRGQANIFQFGDPLATYARGSAGGNPVVRGGDQTGFTLATQGWPISTNGVLLAGDWIQVGYRLYRNTERADSDALGYSTLKIWPNLREIPADAASIVVTGTKGLWRLKTNTRKWSETAARYYGLQFEVREAMGAAAAIPGSILEI